MNHLNKKLFGTLANTLCNELTKIDDEEVYHYHKCWVPPIDDRVDLILSTLILITLKKYDFS